MTESRIFVIGVGRRGCGIAARVAELGRPGLEVLFADTDPEDLERWPEPARLRLGSSLADDEVVRNDPGFARRAALSDTESISRRLEGAAALVLVAGLGGGTGAGGGAALASTARDLGLPSIALVTRPFGLEGEARVGRGRAGLRLVSGAADLTLPFAQDVLVGLASRSARLRELMLFADEMVTEVVDGLASLVGDLGSGEALRSFLESGRLGAASYGVADRPERLADAVRLARAGPFLAGLELAKTRGLAVSIRSREPLARAEVGAALAALARATSVDARLLVSVRVDERLGHDVHLAVVPTGELGEPRSQAAEIWVPGPSG